MKNALKVAMATAIAFSCAPTLGIANVSMCAGQSIPMGNISVSDDGTDLTIAFETDPGWYLTETHVALAYGDVEIPTTKKGNPVPGQFPYSCELDGTLQTNCEVVIAIGDYTGDVQIAAHAAVFQLAGDGCGTDPQYASEVVLNNQGTLADGSGSPAPNRSVEESMFQGGEYPPGTDDHIGFFSLGFGGDVTVAFGEGYPVYNAPGIDLCIQEITNGRSTYPLESAELFGVNEFDEVFIAEVTSKVTSNGYVCVDLPDDAATVDFVKIDDNTDPNIHADNADGYDVDFIAACYLFMGEETAWGAACGEGDGTPFVPKGNWGTYFTYTIAEPAETCPCFSSDDINSMVGEIIECGDDIQIDGVVGIIYSSGDNACSGPYCGDFTPNLSCGIASQSKVNYVSDITEQQNSDCQTIIRDICPD